MAMKYYQTIETHPKGHHKNQEHLSKEQKEQLIRLLIKNRKLFQGKVGTQEGITVDF